MKAWTSARFLPHAEPATGDAGDNLWRSKEIASGGAAAKGLPCEAPHRTWPACQSGAPRAVPAGRPRHYAAALEPRRSIEGDHTHRLVVAFYLQASQQDARSLSRAEPYRCDCEANAQAC